mmetsp:Transcript_108749/g.307584  ORF Transcript_108749/g.307584 Transcript_108749/m.307584 type:complete len:304 (+) Transcript_108749:383-1294(+)
MSNHFLIAFSSSEKPNHEESLPAFPAFFGLAGAEAEDEQKHCIAGSGGGSSASPAILQISSSPSRALGRASPSTSSSRLRRAGRGLSADSFARVSAILACAAFPRSICSSSSWNLAKKSARRQQPRDQMSAFSLYASPLHTSGGMNAGVPHPTVFCSAAPPSSAAWPALFLAFRSPFFFAESWATFAATAACSAKTFAREKSMILGSSSAVSKTLAVLRSRCITPFAWRKSTPRRRPRATRSFSACLRSTFPSMAPPSVMGCRGITEQSRPSIVHMSRSSTTCGWDTASRLSAARSATSRSVV